MRNWPHLVIIATVYDTNTGMIFYILILLLLLLYFNYPPLLPVCLADLLQLKCFFKIMLYYVGCRSPKKPTHVQLFLCTKAV